MGRPAKDGNPKKAGKEVKSNRKTSQKTTKRTAKRKLPESDSDELPQKKRSRKSKRIDSDEEESEIEDEDEQSQGDSSNDENTGSESSEFRDSEREGDEDWRPEFFHDQDIHKAIDQHWSARDEAILNASTIEELTLWRKCLQFHRRPPGDFLPQSQRVTTVASTIDYESTQISNTNWATTICTKLSKLILLPPFREVCRGSHRFLIYCVLLAISTRLGRKASDPGLERCSDDRYYSVFDCIENLQDDEGYPLDIMLSEAMENKIKDSLQAEGFYNLPAYWEFSKCIPRVVNSKNKTKNQTDLIGRGDMIAIADAWDMFVKKKENFMLLTVDQISNLYGHFTNQRMTTKAVLQVKKLWIVKGRMEQGQIRRDISPDIRATPEIDTEDTTLGQPKISAFHSIFDNKVSKESIHKDQFPLNRFQMERKPKTTPCGVSIIQEEPDQELADNESYDGSISLMQETWTEDGQFAGLGSKPRLKAWREKRRMAD
ncbi:hypothetical protein BTUL_0052g00640 [Botrytis tulipae]|uniref:Uncharacterized protein n=1 Tax=Botrytis tulipae TaxID=87230 RepID=A0A4Z1EQB9_9HELO|nr:hypothetical protein BTUL_0052g00640 [Botrytis tulipae]